MVNGTWRRVSVGCLAILTLRKYKPDVEETAIVLNSSGQATVPEREESLDFVAGFATLIGIVGILSALFGAIAFGICLFTDVTNTFVESLVNLVSNYAYLVTAVVHYGRGTAPSNI